VTATGTGRVNVDVRLKALGVLGVYISGLDDGKVVVERDLLVLLNGAVVPVRWVGVDGTGAEGGYTGSKAVLRIDLEGAWKEMGLRPGWGDEVAVTVVVLGQQEEGE